MIAAHKNQLPLTPRSFFRVTLVRSASILSIQPVDDQPAAAGDPEDPAVLRDGPHPCSPADRTAERNSVRAAAGILHSRTCLPLSKNRIAARAGSTLLSNTFLHLIDKKTGFDILDCQCVRGHGSCVIFLLSWPTVGVGISKSWEFRWEESNTVRKGLFTRERRCVRAGGHGCEVFVKLAKIFETRQTRKHVPHEKQKKS